MRLPRAVRPSLAVWLVALGLLVPAPAPAAPVAIRASWVIVPSSLTPILFEPPGVARHVGQSYTLDAVHFSGTPEMITALAAGELDVALLSYSALALAIENAGMGDLRVIADDFQDGVDGWFTDQYMVLKDSPIRTVEDLKGKVLASNGAGSAIDMGLRAMLRRHGLEDKKDVTIVEVNLPNMRAALEERRVDLVSAVTQVAEDPETQAIARPLFTQKDALGTTQMILWAARAGFIAAHRAALVDLLEDMLRARRFYIDPANHAAALAIVARFTKLPPERFASWVFTRNDYYRDPDGQPNLKALQSNIDAQHELAFLKKSIVIGKYADLSLVEEAARRIDAGGKP